MGKGLKKEKEIMALLHLVDDPDNEVYETVAGRLLGYGQEIVPKLEQLWDVTEDEQVQERIESLIHRVHYTDLQRDFSAWASGSGSSLLEAAILLSRFRYPELERGPILSWVDQMKRNVWLEMNYTLTPLEQINILNSIVYNYYKLKGHEISQRKADLFYINQTFENNQGNAYTLGVIYLAICEAMDIPIFAVNLPGQFVLGFFDSLYHFLTPEANPLQTIQFFIDPVNGLVYSRGDVEVYLKRIKAVPSQDYFMPLMPKEIMTLMIEELAQTYQFENDGEKAAELRQLIAIINSRQQED